MAQAEKAEAAQHKQRSEMMMQELNNRQ